MTGSATGDDRDLDPRQIVRDELGLGDDQYLVNRRRFLAGLGASTLGVASVGSGSADAQESPTGGPAEFDELVVEQVADVDEWDVEELSGDLVAREAPIEQLDLPVAVGEHINADEYLIVNDPDGGANANLTALRAADGGSWAEADNFRRIQNGSVDQEYSDADILTADGGEWAEILEVSALPDSERNRWPFDEGSGTTAFDTVGGADATISGATWVEDAASTGGYHLTFDTTDDTVIAPSNSDFEYTGTDAWTFGCFFQSDESSSFGSNRSLVRYQPGAETWFIRGSSGTPNIQFFLRGSGNNTLINETVSVDVLDGGWHSAFMTVDADAGSAECYIDGVEEAAPTFSTSGGFSGAGDLGLGCRDDGSDIWSGGLDDPRNDVYRTASEIADIHNGHGQT